MRQPLTTVDDGLKKTIFPALAAAIDGESVADEQRVGVARDNALLFVAIDERSERIIVRSAAAEGHFAVVPMAGLKPRLEAEGFPFQRRLRRFLFFPRQRDIAPRAV